MKNYPQAAVITIMWAVVLLVMFPIEEYAQILAFVFSVGGMAVLSYNYLTLLDKVISGEVRIEDLLTRR